MTVLSEPEKRRWVAWAALATVFLLVNLHRLSTAVLSGRLTAAFGTTASQLGTLHASFFLIYAVVQIPVGVLVDRVGPRRIGSIGGVVLSVGAIGFAISESYVAAFAARALIGFGSGAIFVSILRFCANWYRADEFATMTGLTAGVAGLGAILATTPLAVAVDAAGWRPTVLTLGAVGVLAAVAVAVLAHDSPVDAGLEPIAGVPERATTSLAETREHLRTLIRDGDQWLLSIVFFAGNGTVLTLIGLWGVPYLVVVYGLDVTTASYFTLLGSVGMLVGSPAVGWLSDRLERRVALLAGGLAIFAVALGVIPAVGRPPLPVVAGVYFVCGFLLGAVMLSLSVIKERYPASASGVATATVNAAGFVGGTVFPTVLGMALDAYRTGDTVEGTVVYTQFGYRVAFAILAVGVGIAFLCSLALLVRTRRRGTGAPERSLEG
ncbi:MFS transporter [Halopiger xanaduensis]|uniref:Major facilitator superfamily MFS_1 n=1 Tax=Halopiger xanaduensis (strain DSM 18323 / JCM 14033 / SH-6) TaxID=797210 RepID=F8D4E4_HALXS|nr:MFS transporter [Halopiger xanaduensis]AEH38686.1 major facilitator superfamily MFS_1 [Halopiger xanaduensis SH-6]